MEMPARLGFSGEDFVYRILAFRKWPKQIWPQPQMDRQLHYSFDLTKPPYATSPLRGKTNAAGPHRTNGCTICRPTIHTLSTSFVLIGLLMSGIGLWCFAARDPLLYLTESGWSWPDYLIRSVVWMPHYTGLAAGHIHARFAVQLCEGSAVYAHIDWSASVYILCQFLPYIE